MAHAFYPAQNLDLLEKAAQIMYEQFGAGQHSGQKLVRVCLWQDGREDISNIVLIPFSTHDIAVLLHNRILPKDIAIVSDLKNHTLLTVEHGTVTPARHDDPKRDQKSVRDARDIMGWLARFAIFHEDASNQGMSYDDIKAQLQDWKANCRNIKGRMPELYEIMETLEI